MTDQVVFPKILIQTAPVTLPVGTQQYMRASGLGGLYCAVVGSSGAGGKQADVVNVAVNRPFNLGTNGALETLSLNAFYSLDLAGYTQILGKVATTLKSDGFAGDLDIALIASAQAGYDDAAAKVFLSSSYDWLAIYNGNTDLNNTTPRGNAVTALMAAVLTVDGASPVIGSAQLLQTLDADIDAEANIPLLTVAQLNGLGTGGASGTLSRGVGVADAGTLSQGDTSKFPLLVHNQGDFGVTHTPAVNTKATISKVNSGSGAKLVCTSITATIIGLSAAAETVVDVVLRDGATGVGTILWSTKLLVRSSTQAVIALTDLTLVGSANTNMTLEFSAAGGASTYESVALTGHLVSA